MSNIFDERTFNEQEKMNIKAIVDDAVEVLQQIEDLQNHLKENIKGLCDSLNEGYTADLKIKPTLIRNIAKCLSIKYLSASTKDEFLSVVNQWIKPGERASLFEVFVEEEDDVSALRTLNMLGINKKKRVLNKVRRMFRK